MSSFDTFLHLAATATSALILLTSLQALVRMSRLTAKPIQAAYMAIFFGSGTAVIIGLYELVAKAHVDDAMHLALLIIVAGLCGLMFCSRRRDCMCVDCPARKRPNPCDPCDIRGPK